MFANHKTRVHPGKYHCMYGLYFYKFGFNCFITNNQIITYFLFWSNPVVSNRRPAVLRSIPQWWVFSSVSMQHLMKLVPTLLDSALVLKATTLPSHFARMIFVCVRSQNTGSVIVKKLILYIVEEVLTWVSTYSLHRRHPFPMLQNSTISAAQSLKTFLVFPPTTTIPNRFGLEYFLRSWTGFGAIGLVALEATRARWTSEKVKTTTMTINEWIWRGTCEQIFFPRNSPNYWKSCPIWSQRCNNLMFDVRTCSLIVSFGIIA